MEMEKIKSEIIQELLFKYVQKLSYGYDNIQVNDSNMINDNEMYIYVDVYDKYNYCGCVYECNCSENIDKYKEYLCDYKKDCDEFIKELRRELPKYLGFSEMYIEMSDEDMGDDIYYESCELHFKICDD